MQTVREKAIIMDARAMDRAIIRIAHEIIERNADVADVALIGIQRRGVPIAQRIAERISAFEGVEIPVGKIDITIYRDDLADLKEHPLVEITDIPFAIYGRTIIMVDDVVYTGRTARAAMDAIIDMGRPKVLQFAALVDRGHRELPIRPDYIGKNVPTSREEHVAVSMSETDGADRVAIVERVF